MEAVVTVFRFRPGVCTLAVSVSVLLSGCDDDVACDTRNPLMPVCTPPAPVLMDEPVVFTSTRDGRSEVYVMNADGSRQVRLTDNSGEDSAPTWSPDGARVVWASARGGVARQLHTMNSDGSDVRRLTSQPGTPGWPDWSPDGRHIAYHAARGDGNWDIWVINADGTEPRRLTTSGSGQRPRWSPDGRRIAYTYHHLGGTLSWAQIALMSADGSGLTILGGGELQAIHADWSPDGRQLAFSTWQQANGGLMGTMRLAIINDDGSGLRLLGSNTMGAIDIDWSATSGRIYFASSMTGFNQVFSIRPDGTDLRRLTGLAYSSNTLPRVR
jgi:Tol biopolymer transport system component